MSKFEWQQYYRVRFISDESDMNDFSLVWYPRRFRPKKLVVYESSISLLSIMYMLVRRDNIK